MSQSLRLFVLLIGRQLKKNLPKGITSGIFQATRSKTILVARTSTRSIKKSKIHFLVLENLLNKILDLEVK